MSKTYRCNKINEKGSICNETDENNFSEGRYSTCKKCRLRVMSEYNKAKKEQKQNEDANKIDPDNHIRYLIEDTITRVPLLDNKMSVVDKFNDLDTEMSNVFNSCINEMRKLSERIKKIEKENSEMEEEILTLKIQAKNTQKHIKNILNEEI